MIYVYESKLCMATIIFYTCIYTPFLQVKQALCSILGFILDPHQNPLEYSGHSTPVDLVEAACSVDLPTSRYGDKKKKINGCNDNGSNNNNHVIEEEEEEACSVCLVEFESEDNVSQLSKCGHVFHKECIEKWVKRDQYTCPLCRSSFLHMHESKCSVTCNSMLSCFS